MEPIWSVVKRLLSVSLKNERNGINQKTDGISRKDRVEQHVQIVVFSEVFCMIRIERRKQHGDNKN